MLVFDEVINQIHLLRGARNILRTGVTDCRGLPPVPVGFEWNLKGPGIEPGSVRDKKNEHFSLVLAPPIIFVETLPQKMRGATPAILPIYKKCFVP